MVLDNYGNKKIPLLNKVKIKNVELIHLFNRTKMILTYKGIIPNLPEVSPEYKSY